MNNSPVYKSVYILFGVSGCGKTTIGKELAKQLALPFYDADEYHPQSNIDKMKSGIALRDADRIPWLDKLSSNITRWTSTTGAVLACSALREVYRTRLSGNKNNITWILLNGSKDLIAERLKKRVDHFFDPALLQSQIDLLEIPDYGMHINVDNGIRGIIDAITSKKKKTP